MNIDKIVWLSGLEKFIQPTEEQKTTKINSQIKMEVRLKKPLVFKSNQKYKLFGVEIKCEDIVCSGKLKDIGNKEFMLLDQSNRNYKKISKQEILSNKDLYSVYYLI